ncbi:MAG TPA: S1/P1 nuclease [Candidatus Angelobacter sp.]|nr:S1/P1 nuclease [Candidatus Angelobacter sp.]
MRSVSRCFLLFLFLCATSSLSFGWGCSGHQIVALIAQKQLTATARQAVLDLLSGTPIDPTLKRFCSQTTLGAMADVATWADDFRDKDPSTGDWHFWDIPLNVKKEPGATEFCDHSCVNQAVETQLKVLQSADAAREDKVKALMFVIHFMGDMHQPLHVVNNNDRGGNCIPASFFELQTKLGDKSSSTPNLHGIWDTSILERIGGIRRESHDADIKHFANLLSTRYAALIAQWKVAPVKIEDWAWESHELADKFAYDKLTAAVTPEDPVAVSTCADDNNIGQRMFDLHESVGKPYVTAVSPVIEKQLAKAGARLADVLNHTLIVTPKTAADIPQDQPVSPGAAIQLKLSNVKAGAVLTVSGITFTNGFTPSLGTLQGEGVKDIQFGTTTMTISMQDPLPGDGTVGLTVYTDISYVPVLMGFIPEGSASLTITPLFVHVGSVSTNGPRVSLGLPSPMPSCSFQGCGPELSCANPIDQCMQDKKKRVFNCCP